jgi:hypothetical protein
MDAIRSVIQDELGSPETQMTLSDNIYLEMFPPNHVKPSLNRLSIDATMEEGSNIYGWSTSR